MRKIIITTAIVTAIGVTAFAQNNEVIKTRQETMQRFGQAMKALTPMAKGEVEFDQVTATAALVAIAGGAQDLPPLFPEDSQTGTGVEKDGVPKETAAAPAIWENRSGFDQTLNKFMEDTASAAMSEPASNEDIAAAMKMFAGQCKDCHEDYRIKSE